MQSIQKRSIEERIPNSRLSVMVMGALLVIAGIAVIANPGTVSKLLTQLIGVAMVVSGVICAVPSIIRFGGVTSAPPGDLVLGGVQVALGLVVALAPGFFVRFIFTLLGLVIVATGAADLWRANEERKLALRDWQPEMIIGVVTLIVGILVVVAPFAFATLAAVLCGIALIADGASELYLGWKML